MNNDRTINATRNIFFGYLNKVLTMFFEFIVRYFFIKYLGEELLGINEVYTNVIQFLSLAELGLNNVVGYSLYEPLAHNDEKKITELVTFYKNLYNKIAIIVSLLGLMMIPFLRFFVNVEISNITLVEIYLLFLVDTVVSYLMVYKCTLITADQKGYLRSKYELIFSLTRVVLQIIVLVVFKNIILYLLVKIICSILLNVYTAQKADRLYPYIKGKEELDEKSKKDIFQTIKAGFIYKLSAILLNSTDNLLISIMVGTVWVGYLANYITIINGISAFYTIIFSNLTAGVGNLVAIENKDKKNEIFDIMLCTSSWMAIIFSVCFLCLSSDFVSLWIGQKYVLSNAIVLLKSIMLFVSCSMQPIYVFREALGLYKKTKYIMLLSAVSNIIISVILGKFWGITGILLASLIAIFSTYYWYDPKILYKECFEKDIKIFWRKRVRDFVYVFIGIVVFSFCSSYFQVNSWIMWVIKACIIFVLVNMFCAICYKDTWIYNYLKNMVVKFVGGKK